MFRPAFGCLLALISIVLGQESCQDGDIACADNGLEPNATVASFDSLITTAPDPLHVQSMLKRQAPGTGTPFIGWMSISGVCKPIAW
jgi:hypothetical protein